MGTIMKHVKYLWYVLKHKWYVFLECCRLGIPWLGLIHDWHKFLPGEWSPYVNHFYGPGGTERQMRGRTGYYKPTDTGDAAFDFAWLLHQKRGRHHWQWWVLPENGGGVKILPMHDRYRREMLCDWYGAARAQGKMRDSVPQWYEENGNKMQLHPDTRDWIEGQLGGQR